MIASRRPVYLVVVNILILVAILVLHAAGSANDVPSGQLVNKALTIDDYKILVNNINYSNILRHIIVLSSVNSRVTGYEGHEKAADYIKQEFASYGLHVYEQTYEVLSPVDEGTAIVYYDAGERKEIPAYALWPNYVQPCYVSPLNPIKGKLVYVGKGELEDFNGKDVDGAIVVMDFNSKDNWINAAKLGAKAVIFLEPDETAYAEARAKFLLTPLYFPRLYVQRQYARELLELAMKGEEVTIFSNMTYKNVKARNIIAVLEGSEYPSDIIVVAAHYDTWSVVPGLAPGADEASSVASLLELARVMSHLRPRRTVWFVALSGHWLALSGAREFVEKYFFNESKRIWAFIALDFSTDNSKVDLLYAGHFYEYTGGAITAIHTRWTRWLEPKIFKDILPKLENATGRKYDVESGFVGMYGWWGSIYGPYMLDSEPFAIAHGLGFAIRTVSLRQHWGHPLSTLKYVKIENLKPQLEVAAAIAYSLAEEGVEMPWNLVSPARALYVAGGAEVAGYITLQGVVLQFNYSKGWYDPVPGAIVAIIRGGPQYSTYPFYRILVKSDDKGRFVVHGIGGLFAVSHAGWGGAQIYVEAYKIDEATGRITYAPDFGQYGSMQIPFYYQPDRHPFNVSTVVFECSSIAIFDLIDPIRIGPIMFPDPRFQSQHFSPWHSVPSMLQVLDQRMLGPFVNWGISYSPYEQVAMIFVPPNTRVTILYKLTSAYTTVGILANASVSNPEGEGLTAPPKGGQLVIPLTAYKFAHDVYLISKSRYDKLALKYVRSYIAEEHLEESAKWLNLAEKCLAAKNYSAAYRYAKAAWIRVVHGYNEVMRLLYDSATNSMVVLTIFIPSAILFEAFVIGATGRARLLTIALTLLAVILTYYFVHPAPQIAAVFWLSPLCIGIELLLAFTAGLFLGKIVEAAKRYREKVAGKHFAEVPTVDLSLTLLRTSIQFMRRRKLRSGLTLFSVIVIMFSLVGLTSVVPIATSTLTHPTIYSPSYKGMMITRLPEAAYSGAAISIWYSAGGALSIGVLNYRDLDVVETIANSSFAVRVWWYPQSVQAKSVYATVVGRNGTYNIKAMLGLSPLEIKILNYSNALIEGMWLPPNLKYVCILPSNIARRINVSVGDTVSLPDYGLNLTVIGILDPYVANRLRDLNGFSVAPVNPDSVSAFLRGYVQQENWISLSFEEIIIIPYDLALDIGGFVVSIATPIKDFGEATAKAMKLSKYFENINIYISDARDVLMCSPFIGFGFYGWSTLLIPLVIAALFLANTMLGNIRERVREINVFASLGLSPRGIGWMFIAEALTYALLGYTFGYVTGTVANIVLYEYRILPPNFIVNASSLATALALFVGIGAILVPTIYPATVAARTVVPSLERKWKLTTKPRGDVWEIPLPYSSKRREEILGFLRFLKEYLEFHKKESTEIFITDNVELDTENLKLTATLYLQPLESGVYQEVNIFSEYYRSEDRYALLAQIKLLKGRREAWIPRVPVFIDVIRRQILLWRGLAPSERERYMFQLHEGGGR